MWIEFDSQDKNKTVDFSMSTTDTVLASSTASPVLESHGVVVFFSSTADQVALSIKPSVLAQEERQERLTRTVRLGFPPISMSTQD